jgi:hypothetical protein
VRRLTDNGREFCGKLESHPYELLLAVEGIKHRTTEVATPLIWKARFTSPSGLVVSTTPNYPDGPGARRYASSAACRTIARLLQS